MKEPKIKKKKTILEEYLFPNQKQLKPNSKFEVIDDSVFIVIQSIKINQVIEFLPGPYFCLSKMEGKGGKARLTVGWILK